ncbi:hypothetical protein LCGC14_0350230 [marine sediment metagenome]|uniref:Calcineurin-like phosphoesterase domain-containing protein n=1 Tax=marine sediment metagenome TaxID=412755 RepID=A0A0F9VYI4_9ZZZZ
MAEEELILSGEPIYYSHTLNPKFKGLIIAPISDVHYGNPLFSKKHFLQTVKYLKDTPNAYTLLNGDMCESTIKTSKGEIFKQVGSPQDQRDWIIDQLEPIKKKILGMTIGNHEMRIYNEVGIDICKDIAKALGVPYRASGMLLKIAFGDWNRSVDGKPFVYWGYFSHGYGGARTKSAKAVKVERVATWIHADFYCLSHDHVVNAAPDIYLLPDPRTRAEKDADGKETGFTVGRLTAHRKMLVKTNAYLKWGGYAEMLGFPPSDLTTPLIKLFGTGKPTVRVEV